MSVTWKALRLVVHMTIYLQHLHRHRDGYDAKNQWDLQRYNHDIETRKNQKMLYRLLSLQQKNHTFHLT